MFRFPTVCFTAFCHCVLSFTNISVCSALSLATPAYAHESTGVVDIADADYHLHHRQKHSKSNSVLAVEIDASADEKRVGLASADEKRVGVSDLVYPAAPVLRKEGGETHSHVAESEPEGT